MNEEQTILHKIVRYTVTDSTNNQAKKEAEKGAPSGTLFLADQQTGGRGRQGKNWISPPGTGIWMTLLLRPQLQPQTASMLTLVAAMAVADALQKETGEQFQIKWPNDILLHEKKLCGILTETAIESRQTEAGLRYVIIGIGINVNTSEMAEEIRTMATSLYLETGKRFDREAIVRRFGQSFYRYYEQFVQTGSMRNLKQEYEAMLANTGRQVKVAEKNERAYTGVAEGINEEGELLVRLADGTRSTIRAGEVSVRGLYGYV